MGSKYKKFSFQNVNTYSIKNRFSKVQINDFAKPVKTQDTIEVLIKSLPNILIGKDFKDFINQYKKAVSQKKFVIWMTGAHIIKCGLSPVVIELMKDGYINHLAMNGAGAIHDVEIAMWGITSEDVATGLKDGSFGMAKETADFINFTVAENSGNDMGYAEVLANKLLNVKAPHARLSLLASAYQLNIPISLHPALGTEIIHQHPSLDGAAFGEKSLLDFKLFTDSVSQLTKGSMVLNVGSAVILPEVFLKALTVVRNLNYEAYGLYTAVFDMIRHYRPAVNVMQRPTQESGKGYYFIGHHEIMIPLLAGALRSG